MKILCLGLSHRTTPVELRERLSFSDATLRAVLARFGCGQGARPDHLSELVVLSTCNRLELYACASHSPADDPVHALLDFLAEVHGVRLAEFEHHLYRYIGVEAARHLCRVAAGLDSMILGEPQVLGQVTEAYERALGQHTVGRVLSALFRTAIRAGKRARTETAISRNPASASSVAIRLAEQVVGKLVDRQALVIGAGEMGELVLEALRVRGVRHIAIVNRTQQRATELANRWGGQAYGFEQMADSLVQADIVITSTGAPHTIIGPALLRDVMAQRPQRPLVFMDIAVPRDVDPAVKEIPGVHVFDIDDLHSRLDGSIAERQSEIPLVEAIVEQEVANFEAWLRGVEVMPVIADLRQKAEAIRQSEIERTLRHLPDLDPQIREHIQHLSRSLVNKLLHEPTVHLRAEAGNGHAAEYAETVRQLFGLALEPPQSTTPSGQPS
jgi:glutamyl-tRNA reductase